MAARVTPTKFETIYKRYVRIAKQNERPVPSRRDLKTFISLFLSTAPNFDDPSDKIAKEIFKSYVEFMEEDIYESS